MCPGDSQALLKGDDLMLPLEEDTHEELRILLVAGLTVVVSAKLGEEVLCLSLVQFQSRMGHARYTSTCRESHPTTVPEVSTPLEENNCTRRNPVFAMVTAVPILILVPPVLPV